MRAKVCKASISLEKPLFLSKFRLNHHPFASQKFRFMCFFVMLCMKIGVTNFSRVEKNLHIDTSHTEKNTKFLTVKSHKVPNTSKNTSYNFQQREIKKRKNNGLSASQKKTGGHIFCLASVEGISPRQFHYVALGPADLTTFPAGHRSAPCAKLQCSSRKAFSSSSIPCCVLFFSEFLFPSVFWVLSAGFCSLIRKSWNLHCRGLSNGCGVHVKCFQSWKMFECIQAILTADMANMASIEDQSNMSLNQLHGLKTSQNHNFQGAFECPQFPKFRLLRRQNFLQVFLPLVPLGLPAAWASGLELPRPNTAAFGSRMGPRIGGRTAPWGQGRYGCGEQHGPWPRTKDLGWKPSWCLEAMGSLWGHGWTVDGSSLLVDVVFNFSGPTLGVSLSQLPFLHPFVCRQFLISNCQHGSMDPDILTVTSPIVWNM